VLAWLSAWSEVQTCIWPSWCQCHSLSLASVKSRLVFPFWYWLIRGSPGQRAINRVCVSLLMAISTFRLGRRCLSSPQQCYLHCLSTLNLITANHCWYSVQFFGLLWGVVDKEIVCFTLATWQLQLWKKRFLCPRFLTTDNKPAQNDNGERI